MRCDQWVRVDLNAQPVLLPNEIAPVPGGLLDDFGLCEMIVRGLGSDGPPVWGQRGMTAAEHYAAVGRMSLVVGSRFHSLVFALKQDVPTVTLGWSHKYKELMSPFGLSDFCIPHALNPDRAQGAVREIWKDRETWRIRIRRVRMEHEKRLD